MLNLYTETAFQPASANQSSVLDFDIPRNDGSYERQKAGGGSGDHMKDEQAYANRFLASSSDIYYRQNKIAPRCILWRVVGRDRTLELYPADISRSESDHTEAHLILQFRFQDPLLPGCIAITDSTVDQDIHLFACTSRNEITHLRINPAAFREPGSLNSDIGQWASAVEISSLSIDTVYRTHAHSPFELFIAYTSGIVQRVRRKADSARWEPENYDDSTWKASLGKLIGRGTLKSVDHGTTRIDARAAQAMIVSPDSTHLYTLCLNHHVRVWNLSNGRLVAVKDMLNVVRDSQDQVLLNPSDRSHLQLVRAPHMRHAILVTFSPHDGGRFKLWDVKGGLTEPLSLEDKFPSLKLNPPDPDPSGTHVWSLTGFHMSPGDLDQQAVLWVLWRNNNYHRLYSLNFELENLNNAWLNDWVTCNLNNGKEIVAPDPSRVSSEDVTRLWLDYLFTPERYPKPVLETALAIYSKALSLKENSSTSTRNLQSRLCSIVATAVSLRKYGNSSMEYDRFIADTDYHWRNFWRIAENINESRSAPLSLSFDNFVRQPWVVMTDKCAVVRECSTMELLKQTGVQDFDRLEDTCSVRWPHRRIAPDMKGYNLQKVAVLLDAACNFRKRFPTELARNLEVLIEEDLLDSVEKSTPIRLFEIYDSTNFAQAISDEVFQGLETDLDSLGELGGLRNDIFFAVLDVLGPSQRGWQGSSLRSTLFGKKLFAAGTYDLLIQKRQILRDILALVIFIDGEVNQEDEKMDNFDPAALSDAIAQQLKLVERDLFLAAYTRPVPLFFEETQSHQRLSNPELRGCYTTSVLEDVRWRAIEPIPAVEWPQAYTITQMLLEIQDFISGVRTVDYVDGTVYLLGDLLVHREYDTATKFLAFVPPSPWAMYMKGRLYLAKGYFSQAAQLFQQAAHGLACGKALGDLTLMCARLLTSIEANSFFNGTSRYLRHVLELFYMCSAYAQAAHFARLALQAEGVTPKEHGQILKSEILSRLFEAELKTRRYGEAFQALILFVDHALQKSSALHLIEAILNLAHSGRTIAECVKVLQGLPWSMHPSLARHLDNYLDKMSEWQHEMSHSLNDWSIPRGEVDNLQLVYAVRVAQNDFKGAVTVLYDRYSRLQKTGRVRNDPTATVLRNTLLQLINLMSLVAAEDAYILSAAPSEPAEKDIVSQNNVENMNVQRQKKRKIIVTLRNLRAEYQRLLDRCSRVERGDFDFDFDFDDNQSDMLEEGEVNGSRLDFSGVTRGDDRFKRL